MSEKENTISEIENGQKSPSVLPEEVEPIVTTKTWVVVVILSFGYGLSFLPVPAMAAIGPQVAADLGNASANVWFVSAWVISITISFLISGANTDPLGRRWFLVMGSLICAVGHIVVATAQNTTAIIAGLAVTGFGAANCQMAAFALSELLPNKWRHIGIVLADAAVYFDVIVIPITARYGFYEGSWRANFYAAAGAQFLSFLGLYFLYFPPAHPLGVPYRQAFKELDYVGMFLFIGGSLPFLVGIVWASIYPSTDAHIIAPIVVGGVVLIAFAVWETYGPVKRPLTPHNIFVSSKGRDFTAPVIALAVINMFYYSSSIIWPTMINVFYTDGTDWREAAILSLPQNIAITAGGLSLGAFGGKIRHWQWQQTVSVTIMVLFGSLLALGRPDNKAAVIAFLFISNFAYGWAIYLAIMITQLGVKQEQLGTSGGLGGAGRFAGGAIAQAVYLAILGSVSTKKIAELVPAAAISAGLPASKVPDLFEVLGTAALATSYPAAVVAAVGAAVQEAYRVALADVAFASLGFGCIGIIACLCCKDVDKKMTNKIEVYLENDKLASRNEQH